MPLVRACNVDDLQSGSAIKLETNPPIAVFRVDDKFYATDDTCTHAHSSLSDGYLDGDVVECSFHSARFCVRTGAVLSLPATKPIRTYPVKVEGKEVFVEVD
jgi:nitrite reductase/ring-hydroxylating ferredoxin subunit